MKMQKKSFLRVGGIVCFVLFWMFGFAPLSAAAAEVPIGEDATVGEGSENAAEEEKEAGKIERNGWFKEDGTTYYYISGQMQTGWMKIDGKRYYFSPKSGKMYTEKHKIGKNVYYFKENGQMRTKWVKIKGKKYYFSPKTGKMYTGKHKIGKAVYCFKSNGQMRTKWVKIKGKKYYFSPKTGKMYTGKHKIGKDVYYFKKNGQMQTKWVKISGKEYYFSPETGKMFTGRRKIGKDAYYFNKKGILRTSGWLTVGGKTYYCSEKGVLTSGWMNDNGKYYYFLPGNNEMQTDWQKIGDYNYYFMPSGTEKGVLQSNCIVDTSTGSFYVDAEGIQITSDEIVQAVNFVKTYTDGSWPDDVKLQKCFEALWSNCSYQRFYGTPVAASMPGCASYMFTNRMGNCFCYAASYACVARVLGYESRVAVGSISARNGGMTPHGWAEINVGGTWYICDPNMQRNYPNINSYMRTEATYAYRHACSVRYTLTIQKGWAFWG